MNIMGIYLVANVKQSLLNWLLQQKDYVYDFIPIPRLISKQIKFVINIPSFLFENIVKNIL